MRKNVFLSCAVLGLVLCFFPFLPGLGVLHLPAIGYVREDLRASGLMSAGYITWPGAWLAMIGVIVFVIGLFGFLANRTNDRPEDL